MNVPTRPAPVRPSPLCPKMQHGLRRACERPPLAQGHYQPGFQSSKPHFLLRVQSLPTLAEPTHANAYLPVGLSESTVRHSLVSPGERPEARQPSPSEWSRPDASLTGFRHPSASENQPRMDNLLRDHS